MYTKQQLWEMNSAMFNYIISEVDELEYQDYLKETAPEVLDKELAWDTAERSGLI